MDPPRGSRDPRPGAGFVRGVPEADATCHVRVVHAVPDAASLDFEMVLESGGGEGSFGPLSFAESVSYRAFVPDVWEVRVRRGGVRHGSSRCGCDPAGYYTLVAFGLDLRRANRGPSRYERIRRILGGVEARSDAGSLLQIEVLRDHAGTERGSSYVRVVHAAPGVAAIEVTARGEEGETTVVEGLRYAATGELRRLEPGARSMDVRYRGARLPVLRRELRFEPSTVHTLVVVGTPGRPDRPLELVVLSNPIRLELVEPALR